MAGRGASRGKNRHPRGLLLFAAVLSVVVGAAAFSARAPAELPPELSPDLAPTAQERALLPRPGIRFAKASKKSNAKKRLTNENWRLRRHGSYAKNRASPSQTIIPMNPSSCSARSSPASSDR